MINGKRILAVIPARGGSKGIPLKNLRHVGGHSLVERACVIARQVITIDRTVVSTDHDEIALVAIAAGADVPFRRPEEISGDRVGDWDVLVNALKETERDDGQRYDIIVMLQPTSPLRTVRDVSNAIKMMIEGDYDSVWSVSETDSKSHPYKQLLVENGQIAYWDERGSRIIARQELTPVYHRNGVVYVISRDCLMDYKSIKGDRTGAYIVEGEHVSIDTEFDLELVEMILRKNTAKPEVFKAHL